MNTTIKINSGATAQNKFEPPTPIEIRNDKLAQRIIKTFSARGFDIRYCPDSASVVETALSLIPAGDSVGWGGSDTIRSIGLTQAIHDAGSYTVIDRDRAPDLQTRYEMHRQTLLCDTFLMSTNAFSEDGHLVNIDSVGNRIAALSFGPKSVIVVVGMNKVVKTLREAIGRARNTAAPINAQRFDLKTPCSVTGSCADCQSATSICGYIHLTRISNPAGRIKIILVGENLGF